MSGISLNFGFIFWSFFVTSYGEVKATGCPIKKMGFNTYRDICRTNKRLKNLSYKSYKSCKNYKRCSNLTLQTDIYIQPPPPKHTQRHRHTHPTDKVPDKVGPRFCKKKASLAVRKKRRVLRFWKSIDTMGLNKYQFFTVRLAGEQYRCEVAAIEDYKVFLFIEGRSYQSMADVGYYSLKNIKNMI